MNPHAFQALCNALDLDDVQPVPGVRLTRDFTGDLDFSAAIARREERWRISGSIHLPVRKTVVLASWYFACLDACHRENLLDFLGDLIDAGYSVCVPTSHGLNVMKAREMLHETLNDFSPVSSAAAASQAAGLGIKRDNLCILDAERLRALVEHIRQQYRPAFWADALRHRHQRAIHALFWLPERLSQSLIHLIEAHVQPNERVAVTLTKAEAAMLAESPMLCSRVRYVRLETMPDDALMHRIVTLFPNLEVLDFWSFGEDDRLLPRAAHLDILRAIPGLKFSHSWMRDDRRVIRAWGGMPEALALQAFVILDRSGHEDATQETVVLEDIPSLGMLQKSCLVIKNIELTSQDLYALIADMMPGAVIRVETPHFQEILEEMGSLVAASQHNPLLNVEEVNFCTHGFTRLNLLFQAMPNLKRLSIGSWPDFGRDTLYPEYQYGQLTHLNATGCALTTEQLQVILQGQPRLSGLDLVYLRQGYAEIDWDLIPLVPQQLSHLQTLNVKNHLISPVAWRALSDAAPNLSELMCSPRPFEAEGDFSLTRLQRVVIYDSDGTFVRNALTSPKLQALSVIDCQIAGHVRLLSQGQVPVALSRFELSASVCSLTVIHDFINAASNLQELALIGSLLTEDAETYDRRWVFTLFPALKTLTVKGVNVSADWLSGLLSATPGLTFLELGNTEELSHDRSMAPEIWYMLPDILRVVPALTVLKLEGSFMPEEGFWESAPNALPQLATLNAPGLALSHDQMLSLLQMAPNLSEVSVSRARLTPAQEQFLQAHYPDIRFVFSDVPEESLYEEFEDTSDAYRPMPALSRYADTARRVVPVSGDFQKIPGIRHHAPKLFKESAQAAAIDPMSYHLNTWRWDAQNGEFRAFQPQPANLTPVNAEWIADVAALQARFLESAGPSHYYAQREYAALEPGIWYQLPATGTRDELLTFSSSLPANTIIPLHDAESGYHWFQVQEAVHRPFLLNYTITASPVEAEAPDTMIDASLQDAIGALRFGPDNVLLPGPALGALMQVSIEARIEALKAFFDTWSESGQNLPPETPVFEIFNESLVSRAGACQHRAWLFAALIENLGLSALNIGNGGHAFCTVPDASGERLTINLGGAEAELLQQDMSLEAVAQYQTRPPVNRSVKARPQQVPEPAPDNPFQVWNSVSLEGQDAPSLVREAMVKSRASGRLLLETEDSTSIEALHLALMREMASGAPCFFTPSPDAISLSQFFVNAEGDGVPGTSPLADFVAEAEAHPETPFTWFIDWSSAEARHTALNTILDRPVARIGDQVLPRKPSGRHNDGQGIACRDGG